MAKSVRELFERAVAASQGAWFSGIAVASGDIEQLPRVVCIESGLIHGSDGASLEYSDATFISLSDGPGQSVEKKEEGWIGANITLQDDNTLLIQMGAPATNNDDETQDSFASSGLLTGLFSIDGNIVLLQGLGLSSIISGMIFLRT